MRLSAAFATISLLASLYDGPRRAQSGSDRQVNHGCVFAGPR